MKIVLVVDDDDEVGDSRCYYCNGFDDFAVGTNLLGWKRQVAEGVGLLESRQVEVYPR